MSIDRAPEPGRDAAPDSPSDPDSGARVNDDGTITRVEESGVGPGAGESPMVRVTAPVQKEREDATEHPTLRDDDQAEGGGTPD